jgi:hypothetical protein
MSETTLFNAGTYGCNYRTEISNFVFSNPIIDPPHECNIGKCIIPYEGDITELVKQARKAACYGDS